MYDHVAQSSNRPERSQCPARIGAAALLMVDANQVFAVSEALRRGRVYEQLGCTWYEEPLRADDVDGLAELAHALAIPIASGENNYGKRQFRALFEKKAVSSPKVAF